MASVKLLMHDWETMVVHIVLLCLATNFDKQRSCYGKGGGIGGMGPWAQMAVEYKTEKTVDVRST